MIKNPKQRIGGRDVTPVKPVRFVANPNIREVNWERDVPAGVNIPVHVKASLAVQSFKHTEIRKQLDILRKTRGQRNVGDVKIPADLQQGITMNDTGVRRSAIQNVLPAED